MSQTIPPDFFDSNQPFNFNPLIHAQLRAERSAEGVEEGNQAGKVLLVGELEGDFTLSLAVAREGHGGMESG